jgi:penicillin G amidase
MRFLRLIFSFTITFLLFYILQNRPVDLPYLQNIKALQQAPAFGKFFNPFAGFWMNAEPKILAKTIRLNLPELTKKVDVILDDRLIPHIFAENEHDLYYTQGYITAKYRLWQMETQTRSAAGRISELAGEATLERDKFQRRIGMVYAAEQALKAMEADTVSRKVLYAYTQGVNAYIKELRPRHYPIEYKLLGYAPEEWTALKTALLLKYMVYELSYRNEDLAMTQQLANKGEKVMDELFNHYSPHQSPIVPTETPFKFKKLTIPAKPKKQYIPANMQKPKTKLEDKSGIGSNNWAISGSKSATNYPILANDPHLQLNLPSLWFEIQLVIPNQNLNVYGASLPGAPGIISGFNRDVAWGITNTETDVTDWYQIQFKDSTRQEYFHKEAWKAVKTRIEVIKVKGKEDVKDTILFTHHGPIVALEKDTIFASYADTTLHNPVPFNCALRWIAHDESNELMTFYKLNRAKNYREYHKAIANYSSPAQNFVYADVYKEIAITSQGKFPLKWKGQGKYILDGSNPEHEWNEWIPTEQNPQVYLPKTDTGFVSSANQFPVSDSLYPYYLHWKFAPYSRGKRINEFLSQEKLFTVKDMQKLQNDNLNLFAKNLLPILLKQLDSLKANPTEAKVIAELKKWNYRFEANKIAPSVFKSWWENLNMAIWEDDFQGRHVFFPTYDKTHDLILSQDSPWFDNLLTPEKETLKEITIQSFVKALELLKEKQGALGKNWQWGYVKSTQIKHLLNIPAFNSEVVFCGGDNLAVNAMQSRKGPSWRMIVEIGRSPKAYIIYPGGQSGNPGSFYYDNFIKMWQEGKLAEAYYMRRVREENPRIISRIKLSN